METQGTIGIKATLDISEMQRNVQKYVQNIDMMQDHTDTASQSVARSFSQMKAAGMAFLSIDMAKRLASEMVSVYGTFQQLEIKFTSMLQSGEKAQKLMSELVNFAATTPFDLKGVSQSATQLVAYGTASEDVINKLTRLGNIAAGLSQPIGDLVYLYGTSMTQGKLMTQDLNQFAGRGVPIFSELAKVMGVNKDEIKDLAAEGKIGFDKLEQVVDNLTNKGGMFFNLMQEQSKSVSGKISNIGDNLDMMFNEIGQESDGVINAALDGTAYLIEHYREVGAALAALVALYGVQKAAIIGVAAVQNTVTGIKYTAEIAELSKLIPAKEKSANADLEQAVASGRLTQAKAELIASMRVEAAANVESLRLKALQAKAQYEEAVNTAGLAAANLEAAELEVAAANMKYNSALRTGNARSIENAETQLAIVESNRYSASKQLEAARTNVTTAYTNSSTASKVAETAATQLNTVSQNVNTRSTNFLAVAKTRLAAASKVLGLSMLTNPYVLAAAAIVGLSYGIYKLITYQTDAEKAQVKLNKRIQEFNSETNAEQAEIDRLFGKLDKAKKGTEDYDDAKKSILDKYGEYLKGLGDEKNALDDVARAYGAVSAAAKQAALDRAIADSHSTAQKDWADKQGELTGDLEKAIRDSDKFRNKKGSEREIAAIMQMIKNDLKSGGGLSSETQKIVDTLTKEFTTSTTIAPGISTEETRVGNDVQIYIDRMIANNKLLENTYKDIHDKLGYDTNEYINLTAEQIAKDIAMYEAALERFNKSGKKQVAIRHDGSVSNLMGEGEMLNNIRLLKEAQKNPKDEIKEPNVTKEIGEAIKKVADLKQEIEDLRSGKGKADVGKTIKSTIEDKAKELKEAESALATLTGDDKQTLGAKKKKKEEENKLKVEKVERQRLIDEQNQQDIEKAVQAELELSQAKIDAMDEGFKKQQEQIQLNYRKAKADNDRRTSQYIKDQQDIERKEWEKEHPKYKEEGIVFVPKTKTKEDLSQKKQDTLNEYDKVAVETREKAEATLSKALLEQYQNYTDERLAIEKKFNDDIEALRIQREKFQKEGKTEKVQQTDRSIAQATKMKGESLMGFDYEQLKKSPDYIRAFENLKETSTETLNSLLTQFENAKSAAAQVLSPDQLREYTSTIQSIMDELDSRNPFQSLSDKKKELAEAEEELANAQIELENARTKAEAVKGGSKIENGISSSKYNPATGKIESTKAYLSEAQALDLVKKKTEKYNAAKDKVVKKDNQVKKAEKEVRTQISELADTIDELGKSIGGPAGEIISLIGSIGSFTMTAMAGVEAAADTSANAISTVEKASVILAIIGAAVQIAMKIFDMFGKDDTTEKYEKAKEAYESYINILDRVIEKQLELAETLTGDTANAVYEAAIANIKLQSENAKVLGRQYLNSGASGKSHSKGYDEVDDMSGEGWKQAAKALGMSVNEFKNKMGGRMTGLFDLTDEQLLKLQSDAGIFWSQLDSDTQKFADQIANGVGKVAEVLEQQIVDTTLIDYASLRSDFQDLLIDMDADSADFADSFEEYMKNAILNSMLKEEYMDRLMDWREKLNNAMKNGTIEDEYDNLKTEGQQIADEMKAKRDAMAEMYGWTTDEDSEREASKKGFASMSQDSADELNGRFTMANVLIADIKTELQLHTLIFQGITSGIGDIKTISTSINENVKIIKDNMNAIVGHLSNIDTNTARLEGIEKDMKSMKTGIEKINDKGIKLVR
jgi:tape measure domain-containing protein